MRCGQPGCTGHIVDGYCDVCGLPPVGGSTQSVVSAKPSLRPTGPCRQPGCTGHIVDGYCDVCGAPAQAATQSPAAVPDTRSVASVHLGSIALGSARATSFGTRTRRRARPDPTTGRIGAGLTYVPPAPAIDPEKAILADPVVPEEHRVCPQCGAKVGQAGDRVAGRTEGFCPNCRAPYSFTPKLKPGEIVAGQYRVVGALAHGGMGWIYLAQDENVSERWVVLKGLLNAGDSDAVHAAIMEQQYLAYVTHPLIVGIYNFVTYQDAAYIVMEYVGGRSLKQLLKQRIELAGGAPSPLPPDQALAFLIEILPAFSYLHSQGLLYCDFKPDNVIQVGDSLKLIDLGGVRHLGDDDSPIFGTIGYQAPEVATQGASIASDIYTIGRTLMVLVADVPGYQSTYENTIPPADDVPAFAANDSLYRLLLKCCANDPDDRFASAEELRLQLLGVLRETVAKPGSVAITSTASPEFFPPSGIGDRAGWQYLPLPRLRQDAGGSDTPLDAAMKAIESSVDGSVLTTVTRLVQEALAADPWEWRALWLLGVAALRGQQFADAQAAFNAVYGQLPGELAPKLALAVACELGNQPDYAEALYRVCASTDASYVAPAAFGLARIRAARRDLDGTLAALAMVPAMSRGYPEALRLRAHHLITLTTGGQRLDEAFRALAAAPFPPRSQVTYEAMLLQRALDGGVVLDGRTLSRTDVRARYQDALRRLAHLTDDPAERARLVDQANALRVWSLI